MEKFTVLVYLSTVMVLFKHVVDSSYWFVCLYEDPPAPGRARAMTKCIVEIFFSVALFIFLTDYLFY